MRNRLGLSLENGSESVSVTRERADKFLCALANVPNYDRASDGPNAKQGADGVRHVEMPAPVNDAWRRVFNLFPDLLPKRGNPIHERPNRWIWDKPYEDPQMEGLNPRADVPGLAWQDPEEPDYVIVDDIPPKLKQAWDLPTTPSRRMFLIYELAYYSRGPAMLAAATKAHLADMNERDRAEEAGATTEQAVLTGLKRWSEVLRRESSDPGKIWAIASADPFAQVLLRAVDVADRMRHCPNPTCPAPYFIGQRRSQRYCSDVCALPAQREFKRIWWRDHGKNRRGRKNSRGGG